MIVDVNGTRVGILGYTTDESSYLGDDLVGVILQLTGVNTQDGGSRRFRCHTAVVASTIPVIGYPATSTVDPIDPYNQTDASISTASASDMSGTVDGANLIPTDRQAIWFTL